MSQSLLSELGSIIFSRVPFNKGRFDEILSRLMPSTQLKSTEPVTKYIATTTYFNDQGTFAFSSVTRHTKDSLPTVFLKLQFGLKGDEGYLKAEKLSGFELTINDLLLMFRFLDDQEAEATLTQRGFADILGAVIQLFHSDTGKQMKILFNSTIMSLHLSEGQCLEIKAIAISALSVKFHYLSDIAIIELVRKKGGLAQPTVESSKTVSSNSISTITSLSDFKAHLEHNGSGPVCSTNKGKALWAVAHNRHLDTARILETIKVIQSYGRDDFVKSLIDSANSDDRSLFNRYAEWRPLDE